MRPETDSYPDQLELVVNALLDGGEEAGAAALMSIAYSKREMARRPSITRTRAASVFLRDGFACRYCGGRTILTAVMELIARLYPDSFPYHPNWKGGMTHPAIIARSASVDHVKPVSQGGDPLDLRNLATACWPCNATKADLALEQLGWTLLPTAHSDWRGLTERYPELWVRAGYPDSTNHRAWMLALGLQAPVLPNSE
jgi:HNH endonuclease